MKQASSYIGRFSLLVPVSAILVSVFAIGFLAYTQLYEQRRALNEDMNAHISQQISAAMSLWLEEQIRLAHVLAAAPELTSYCQYPRDTTLRPLARRFLEQAHRAIPDLTLICTILYLPDGAPPVRVESYGRNLDIVSGDTFIDSIDDRSLGLGQSQLSYIKAIAEGAPAFVSEAKANALPGLPPIYVIAVPVRDAQGARVGALVFGVKLDLFTDKFISTFQIGTTGRIEVLDDRGLYVISREQSRVLNPAFMDESKELLTHLNATDHAGAFSLGRGDTEFDYTFASVQIPYPMANRWWVLFSRASHETHADLRVAREWLFGLCVLTAVLMIAMIVRSNLTQARQARERSLRRESELKRVFVDAAPYAVLLVTPQWRIADVNPAAGRIFACEEASLIGRPLAGLIDPGPLFAGMSGECQGKNDEGRRLTFAFDLCELEGNQHLVFLRNETELAEHRRKEAELSDDLTRSLLDSERLRYEAEQANNAKSEFLANMSHELRTPMNAIIGMAHLLLQHNLEPKLRHYTQTIKNAGNSLLGLINSVLDFSKIEAGHMTLEAASFNLDTCLEHMRDLFYQTTLSKGLHFAITCADDVPRHLVGDPLRLEQIMTNLLSNAVKFTDQGSVSLHVAVFECRGSDVLLHVTVADTGIGLSPESCTRLFLPFNQADTSTTRKYGGTGLGLTISRLLVELMDGDISVESTLGAGTRFTFTARLELDDAGNDACPLSPHCADAYGVASGPLVGKRALLVEDNDINQEVALELLRGVGIEADVAENGRIAVDRLTDPGHGFDLVLMDLQMPVMDGYEATRRILAQSHNRDLPIIAMTAHALTSERDRCLAIGMCDHITKPIDVKLLYAALERWIR